ncbi:thiamine phosphate synthase [uncultured Friedmanniella sp.]|uniref:thiamine phosphate synthase n=1 Tax=uncultured Friedmanniella sp. TaxID=335381 RepID=UPI0035C9DF77
MTVLQGLEARLRLARLCLVTDAREARGDLADFLAAAFAGGVDLVQLRPPGLGWQTVEIARQAAAASQGIVGLRGSDGLAGEVQADLLHLGQADRTGASGRPHPYALLGRSTHDQAELADAVADDDLDYLTVGPVYLGPDSAYPAVGLELVRAAATAAPVYDMGAKPWFAVGGITPDTLAGVLEAGARRVCVSAAITEAADPRAAARTLATALRDAWRADAESERYTFAAAASPGRRR